MEHGRGDMTSSNNSQAVFFEHVMEDQTMQETQASFLSPAMMSAEEGIGGNSNNNDTSYLTSQNGGRLDVS